MSVRWEPLARDGKARRGRLHTARGTVETPTFMPCGTGAAIKTLSTEEVRAVGAQIVLGNTYHLFLRPGHERIQRLGGLHRFMRWDGPILTDSGGFQVFSMAHRNKIDDGGVHFRSHLDGTKYYLTPELSMQIQAALGSDIVMLFDECPALPASRQQLERAVERTTRWARRCVECYDGPGALFGIVQGGPDMELRERSARELLALDLPGYAIGGVSVGEADLQLAETAAGTASMLPEAKPRYLMGVGRPEDLVEAVASGIDMFDCVMPTRNARNGQVFVSWGKTNIKRAEYRDDPGPLDPDLPNPWLEGYSRAYLRHLWTTNEHLAPRLLTLQNLFYYQELMRGMREAIEAGRFEAFRESFYAKRSVGGTG